MQSIVMLSAGYSVWFMLTVNTSPLYWGSLWWMSLYWVWSCWVLWRQKLSPNNFRSSPWGHSSLRVIYIGKVFVKNVSDFAALLRHPTCLFHLWWWDPNGIISLCVALPKVAKASTVTKSWYNHWCFPQNNCQCKWPLELSNISKTCQLILLQS